MFSERDPRQEHECRADRSQRRRKEPCLRCDGPRVLREFLAHEVTPCVRIVSGATALHQLVETFQKLAVHRDTEPDQLRHGHRGSLTVIRPSIRMTRAWAALPGSGLLSGRGWVVERCHPHTRPIYRLEPQRYAVVFRAGSQRSANRSAARPRVAGHCPGWGAERTTAARALSSCVAQPPTRPGLLGRWLCRRRPLLRPAPQLEGNRVTRMLEYVLLSVGHARDVSCPACVTGAILRGRRARRHLTDGKENELT